MILEQLAVLVYGVLAMVAALVLSSQTGSPVATALVFVAAGLTYVYQAMQLSEFRGPEMTVLHGSIIVALLLSVTVSLWSFV